MVWDQVALVVWRFERFLDRGVNFHKPMPVTVRQHAEALRPYVYRALYPTTSQRQRLVQDW